VVLKLRAIVEVDGRGGRSLGKVWIVWGREQLRGEVVKGRMEVVIRRRRGGGKEEGEVENHHR
jgi:hypothetical protein